MNFYKKFNIVPKDIVTFTGAGGKTSLIFKLANELKSIGKVLITTTTKMYIPDIEMYENLILQNKSSNLSKGKNNNIDILAKDINFETNKIIGVDEAFLKKHIQNYDYILIEGDGASRKLIKIWSESEPVIPVCSTKVIGIINIDALNKPVSEFAHRTELFCKEFSCKETDVISIETMLKYSNSQDFFKLYSGKRYVFINGVENLIGFETALHIAINLKFEVVIGSIFKDEAYKYKRIAAVILASGFSKRMGKNKSKILYKKETLLENILNKVQNIDFKYSLVVVRNENIENLNQNKYKNFNFILNNTPEKGQSQSVVLGVEYLKEANVDGYMFFPCDQPFLKKESILKLIYYFMKRDKITMPSIKNKFFSPVIFPKRYSEQLLSLTGDRGGKSIIMSEKKKIKVKFNEFLEFHDIDSVKDLDILKKVEGENNGNYSC
ncbi:putative selenium-dependent hydroxylase accessory protein YqeC [Cetobacterium sp. 2A]|uniref:selenium cofactor biosynthesis protein YqeC n=1 Tax=Cetobacterium sp. 2A TaxID=2754723 RepID=UPI00163C76A8|nr:selenium cofactor biosynthesis protein YqeC [Cetobacterium sp. 2A]MBC2855181.1 putative selenium-dependent hydroxylase accessory protein YqeC [Cetobacterium sp. 2A]